MKLALKLWIFGAITIGILTGVLFLSGCRSVGPFPVTRFPDTTSSRGDGLLTSGLRESSSQWTRSTGASGSADELWIVSRNSENDSPADETPDAGSLMVEVENHIVPMPLTHTDVKANVNGNIGTVEVTQNFSNPFTDKIEAVYIFPLPHNAAINEFIMTIGKRHIRGIIRERTEAEKIYREARQQGYVATLLTEERPNIFKQSVANIEPGREIDVTIKYFQTIDYVDGWYEFMFPMVVGPRFNPSRDNEMELKPFLAPASERRGKTLKCLT